MSDELDFFYDSTGQIRRCGSLLPPKGMVSAFQTFEAEHPVWNDGDIRRALTDPNRKLGRKLFGPGWTVNQGPFGQCNGEAGAGVLSRARWLRGITDGLILSGSYIYSKINGGRDQGSNLEDGMRVLAEYGAPPKTLVTYDMIYPNRQPKIADAEAAKHKGLQCYAVQTKQGFRTAVAAGYPVVVAVSAGRGFQTLNNRGIAGVDNGSGNHAVLVDDAVILDDGTEVYDHQNSWGLGYGQQGRSYLTWEHFAQTFGNHVFYAIPSTTEAGL